MSATWTYFKNVVNGIRQLMDPPRRVVVRVWLAVLAAGMATTATFFCPWPWIVLVGILASVLDYLSLQVVYAAADWFFIEGRHYEKGRQASS